MFTILWPRNAADRNMIASSVCTDDGIVVGGKLYCGLGELVEMIYKYVGIEKNFYHSARIAF